MLLAYASGWFLAHWEELAANAVLALLGVLVCLNREKCWRKAKRMVAVELKAVADLWSPWFDLFMVATPRVWNFVLRVITRVHVALDNGGAAPAASQDRSDVRAKIAAIKNGARPGTGRSYRHLLGTQ